MGESPAGGGKKRRKEKFQNLCCRFLKNPIFVYICSLKNRRDDKSTIQALYAGRFTASSNA